MNKTLKILIVIFLSIILCLGGYFLYKNTSKSIDDLPYEIITNETEKSKIATDAFLDIIIQIQKYNSLNANIDVMLEPAMRIAGNLGKVQSSTENGYLEYVPANTIHTIINDLTGKTVQKPIQIEDFYYLYDQEKDYYYIVPLGADWLHYDNIKEVRKIDGGKYYKITCSASCTIGYDSGTTLSYGEIVVTYKYCPENTYARYQLVSITNSGFNN